MFHYFAEKKEKISLYLKEFLKKQETKLKDVNSFGVDVCRRLDDYSVRGKMLRGGLVFLGYDLFTAGAKESRPDKELPEGLLSGSGQAEDGIVKTAAALELLQSALLIHDDIMDRDVLRRGIDTMHVQYEKMLKNNTDKYDLSGHPGESLGLCAGDIAFFLAFSILSSLEFNVGIKNQILKYFSREISFVGVAQMEDIFLGVSGQSVTEERILNLYRYKTGRYTFSLPLMLGATAAGCSEVILKILEKLGEELGIIFQIKDDELGLFGSTDESGKSIGSDIREGKKTLIYHLLTTSLNKEQLDKFASVYGNPEVTGKEIDYIKNLAVSNRIPERVNIIIDRYLESINNKLRELKRVTSSMSLEHLKILENLTLYIKERNR